MNVRNYVKLTSFLRFLQKMHQIHKKVARICTNCKGKLFQETNFCLISNVNNISINSKFPPNSFQDEVFVKVVFTNNFEKNSPTASPFIAHFQFKWLKIHTFCWREIQFFRIGGSWLKLPVHPNTSDDHRGGYIGVFFPFSNA